MESALRVAGLVSRLRGYASGYSAYRRLKAFTRFHRIQLGRGLREALEWLELELAEAGPESLEVRLGEVSVSNLPDTYPPPPEWSVADAWVEVGGERLSVSDSPTLAAAHSPESGGVVEGRGVHVEDPLDPRAYEAARGEVAVVPSGAPWGLAYLLAAEAGAAAVAFYRRDLHPDAVPYTGLFLPYETVKRYGIPAVSLPRRLAERAASGARVRVYVDSDLSKPAKIPVLEAMLPGREGAACGGAVAGTAHACHPAPGANDNGSGVVALAEAVLALAWASEDGAVSPACSVQAVWAPEYTGFIPVALRSRRPVAALNLDMVGVMPGGGEGPLHLYPPPLPLASRARLAGLALHALRSALEGGGVAWELSPFTAGSDHVPLLAGGVEASMVNQWPDSAYHSDRDDVDRISKAMLHAVATAAAAALAAYPGDSWAAEWLAEEYTRALVAGHLARGDEAAARLAAGLGRIVAGLGPLPGGGDAELPVPGELRDSYPRLLDFPVLSVIDLVPVDLDAALKLAARARGLGGYTVALAEPQLLADGSRSAAAIAAVIAAEHGSRAAQAAVESLRILAEAGLVKL